MITCFIRYEIDAAQTGAFEHYAKLWIKLVDKCGGKHHGYLLPSEGLSDMAVATFSVESLCAYETYRKAAIVNPECLAAEAFCERDLMHPPMESHLLSGSVRVMGDERWSERGTGLLTLSSSGISTQKIRVDGVAADPDLAFDFDDLDALHSG